MIRRMYESEKDFDDTMFEKRKEKSNQGVVSSPKHALKPIHDDTHQSSTYNFLANSYARSLPLPAFQKGGPPRTCLSGVNVAIIWTPRRMCTNPNILLCNAEFFVRRNKIAPVVKASPKCHDLACSLCQQRRHNKAWRGRCDRRGSLTVDGRFHCKPRQVGRARVELEGVATCDCRLELAPHRRYLRVERVGGERCGRCVPSNHTCGECRDDPLRRGRSGLKM